MIPSNESVDIIEDIRDGFGIVVITQESEHEFSLHEMNGQKDLFAFFALNSVHLGNRNVRMFRHILLKKIKSPSCAAAFIDLKFFLFLANPETHLAWQIDVFRRDETGIDKSIDGALADHETITVGHADMMRRLSLLDKRGYDLVDVAKLVLGKRYAATGIGKQREIGFMCDIGTIKLLFQSAFRSGSTAIAHIWGLLKARTLVRNEVLAESIAQATPLAKFVITRRLARITYLALLTLEAMNAGIVFHTKGANVFDGQVGSNLF